MTQTDAAWIAGFYDGEGYCGVRNNGKGSYSLSINVGQKDPTLLYKLQFLLNFGTVFGPYRYAAKKFSPYYFFRVSKREQVRQFFIAVWPWLGLSKRNQADAAFEKVNDHIFLPPELDDRPLIAVSKQCSPGEATATSTDPNIVLPVAKVAQTLSHTTPSFLVRESISRQKDGERETVQPLGDDGGQQHASTWNSANAMQERFPFVLTSERH